MKERVSVILAVSILVSLFVVPTVASAEGTKLRVGIMQSKKGEAKKYAPLIAYMKTKDIDVKLVGAKSYDDAAGKFSKGQLDAMFSGSGVAGSMLIKEVAVPLVRPQTKVGANGAQDKASTEDWSTYWAVVVAKKGSPAFDGTAEYFKGKKVICCQLASSGEFFVRSVYGDLPLDCDLKRAASHGAALQALSKGVADIAVVKNRVYTSMSKDPKNKGIFANIEIVGRHNGENPNGTLIVSKSVSVELRQKVKKALLDLESDTSAEAKKLNESLKVRRYIVTTTDDFMYTIPMLKSAGVTRDFNFSFDG